MSRRITKELQARIAAKLADGGSIRDTSRFLDIPRNTVTRNLIYLGDACLRYHDKHVIGLKSRYIQADEIFTFCGQQEHRLSAERKGSPLFGEQRLWIALDPESWLVVNWQVSKLSPATAFSFMADLARRVPNKFQLSTDQLPEYGPAVQEVFGDRIDFGTIKKLMHEKRLSADLRYEASKLRGNRKKSQIGDPDSAHLTTTSVEALNTSIRRWNARFVRDTTSYSKKLENLKASVALHMMFANFCRTPSTSRHLGKLSPAMVAGLAAYPWDADELLDRINVEEKRVVGYLTTTAATKKRPASKATGTTQTPPSPSSSEGAEPEDSGSPGAPRA